MSMPERSGGRRRARWIALAAWACAANIGAAPPAALGTAGSATPRFGKAVTATVAERSELNVFPNGTGLPSGHGTAGEGATIFAAKCAKCHGAGGHGAAAEELVGTGEPLNSEDADKTVGRYWPYATTIFDWVRRAMPMDAPGSLSPDEVYALVAWLLWSDGVIGERDEMNPQTLPRVRMPNRGGFVGVHAAP